MPSGGHRCGIVNHVVEVAVLDDRIPDTGLGEFPHLDEVQVVLPLGVQRNDLIAFRERSDCARDGVAVSDKLVDQVCSEEAVGASEKGGGHGGGSH